MFNMAKNRIKNALLPMVVVPLLLSCLPLSAMEQNEDDLLQEIETMASTLDTKELENFANDIAKSYEIDEVNEIRSKNRILWSIPAAFPEDEFDQQVKNLHANIPFYGKISIGNKSYTYYQTFINHIKNIYNTKPVESFLHTTDGLHDTFKANLHIPENVNPILKNHYNKIYQLGTIPDNKLPGSSLYQYMTGKNIIGIGLYRSDLNDIAFLGANLATEYLLFRDITNAKFHKVKEFLEAEQNTLITLLEKLINTADDTKSQATIKKELIDFIATHCSLFHYNPLKKDVLFPVVKYIALQRVIQALKNEQHSYAMKKPDEFYGFTKNNKNELVRSGVTPVSVVKIAKTFVAPIQELSNSSQEAVHNAIKGLRFVDKFWSSIALPSFCYSAKEPHRGLPFKFYSLLTNVIGETAVLLIATKIIDNLLHEQLINSIIADPNKFLTLLKEGKDFQNIEQSTEIDAKNKAAYDIKLSKELETALMLHKTTVYSWLNAKRATFGKIATAGFLLFVAPSMVKFFTGKIAPIFLNIFKKA